MGKSEGVMNKKVIILVVLMGIILTLFLNSNNKSEEISKTNQKNKLLTMNLEQTAGAGDYKTVTHSCICPIIWKPINSFTFYRS